MLSLLRKLFFPDLCLACDNPLHQGEMTLCTLCRHQLPVTHFHHYNDPALKKVFYGRLDLELATALFYFEKKGLVQQLLHNLKYKGVQSISTFLGNWLGTELSHIAEYREIDAVVPVPLHSKKRKQRGYNQVWGFAEALANALQATYAPEILYKQSNTSTQVFKGRFSRGDTLYDAFQVRNIPEFHNKHLLLVDDIITTGATLEACGQLLKTLPGCRLSIATMAIAST